MQKLRQKISGCFRAFLRVYFSLNYVKIVPEIFMRVGVIVVQRFVDKKVL